MKKAVSVLIVTGAVFMLEFHLLEPVFHRAHAWIEPLLALGIMAALLCWNGKCFK